ncbi:hypothetical protein [Solimonas marina]|uniref:Uncharacterized protein n=1 Tax=Solimonas marina TaxID=2714601 RepID=A0A969W9T5_9GAMM|nr:hypothetical protein [Solimonas marina]NKF21556.1 hypothetical protein [Solimonas marina]
MGTAEPLSTAAAAARRDTGIQRAGEHADRVSPDWIAEAARFIATYAETHVDFLAEDVVAASAGIIAPPPDGRAWGAALRRAAANGVIEKLGYRPAKTSNLSPKVAWGSRVLDLHAAFGETEWKKLGRQYIRAFRSNVAREAFETNALTIWASTRGCPAPQMFRWWSEALEAEGLHLEHQRGPNCGKWVTKPCCAECAESHA